MHALAWTRRRTLFALTLPLLPMAAAHARRPMGAR